MCKMVSLSIIRPILLIKRYTTKLWKSYSLSFTLVTLNFAVTGK